MSFETPSSDTEQPSEKEKLKEFFGHCFEISEIEAGSLVPVGGTSIFSHEVNIKVEADLDNFSDFYAKIKGIAEKYDLSKLREWLDAQGVEVDEKLFAELFAFTKTFEKEYPENENKQESRTKLYGSDDRQAKLSEVVESGSAECAEIAAVSQGYLQQREIPSSYFSGDVLWSKDEEFSDEHSFLVIRQENKTFIYDPTNPTNTNHGSFPSLYAVGVDFDEEMSQGTKKFVEAENILNKEKAYYGVNDGTNVIPEKHIVENNTA
jgi:hypothetical protein